LNDVHDDGLNYYNKVCEFDGATTASSLRRHATAVEVKDDSVDHGPGKATSISYVKTGEKARTSPVVFQTHRPDVGGREAIGKMLHVAGDRRMLKIVGERNVAVRNHSELLRDEVDVTYMSDALFPPLPPPTGPPETTINEVGPSEPLSVPDHVGTEMLEVPPALRVDTTSKACVSAHVPTEIIHGVEPREPLSVPDHVETEMFAAPPVPHVFQNTTPHDATQDSVTTPPLPLSHVATDHDQDKTGRSVATPY
jgi:hypothetical protein